MKNKNSEKSKLIIFSLVIISGLIGYGLGSNTNREALDSSAGTSDTAISNDAEVDFYRQQSDKLTSDYNVLVEDYNNLRASYNASQYQSRAPITCSNYSYGVNDRFTSTNCY